MADDVGADDSFWAAALATVDRAQAEQEQQQQRVHHQHVHPVAVVAAAVTATAADSSSDPIDDAVLNTTIRQLRQQVDTTAEENFELQAALATVDVEYQHKMQQAQQESVSQIRMLREQLRRAQQEANVARSQAKHLENRLAASKQQQQQPSTNSLLNHRRLSAPTSVAGPSQKQVQVSPSENLQQRPQQEENNANTSSNQHQSPTKTTPSAPETNNCSNTSLITHVIPEISCGARLARHLLRNPPFDGSSAIVTQPVNHSSSSSNRIWMHLSRIATETSPTLAVSSMRVIWILLEEVVHAAATAESSDNRQSAVLYVPLIWLNAAMQLASPAACQSILEEAASSAEEGTAPGQKITPTTSRRKRRRRPIFSVGTSQAELESVQTLYSTIYNELQDPFWTPSSSRSVVETTKSTIVPSDIPAAPDHQPPGGPRPLRRTAQTFQSVLCYNCILLQTGHADCIATSVAAMKLLSTLLPHDTDHSLLSSWWGNLLVAPLSKDSDKNRMNLLRLWQGAATVLLKRMEELEKESSKDSSPPVSFRRLINPETDVTATAPDDNKVEPSIEQQDLTSVWEEVELATIREWMATCLDLFIQFWAMVSPSTRQFQWVDQQYGRARSLLACILDVLECVILPYPDCRYSEPLTFSCISWLRALVSTHSGGLLLRSRMPTSQSTATTWHRACSAIGVATKLCHQIVVWQHRTDHLPLTAPKNRTYDPIRDHLVRFFHGVLQMVQHNRMVWDEQQRNMHNISKPSSSKKLHAIVPFSVLVSEYPELYTSAASLLLTVTESSCCKVSQDIAALLKLQMEEIKMDEQESALRRSTKL